MEKEKIEQMEAQGIKPNHPIGASQRIAMTIIDTGVFVMLIFLFYSLIMLSPLSHFVHFYYDSMQDTAVEVACETGYYTKTYGESTEYQMYEDEGGRYYYLVDTEKADDFKDALKENTDYKSYSFNYNLHNNITVSLSGLGALTVVYFIYPVCNKKRQTLGGFFTKSQLISKKYVDKACWYHLLGRLFFIFGIDFIIPYFIFGVPAIPLAPLIFMIAAFTNQDKRMPHEFVSGTMHIDQRTFVPLEEE